MIFYIQQRENKNHFRAFVLEEVTWHDEQTMDINIATIQRYPIL